MLLSLSLIYLHIVPRAGSTQVERPQIQALHAGGGCEGRRVSLSPGLLCELRVEEPGAGGQTQVGLADDRQEQSHSPFTAHKLYLCDHIPAKRWIRDSEGGKAQAQGHTAARQWDSEVWQAAVYGL